MDNRQFVKEGDYNNAPLGTIIIDSEGYAWQKVSQYVNEVGGCWTTCSPGYRGAQDEYPSEYLFSRKPHTAIHIPEQTSEPRKPSQREYATETDIKELNDVPIGTIVKDIEGDEWVKARNGWVPEGRNTNPLYAVYAPYTITHIPPSDLANL